MGGSCLQFQHIGRSRQVDSLRSRDQDHPGQHGETPSLLKIQKISWARWCVPVIPATQEAEAELLEPRRRRLRWAEIAPLHSSLGNKSKTPSQNKKTTTTKKLWSTPTSSSLPPLPGCPHDFMSRLFNCLGIILLPLSLGISPQNAQNAFNQIWPRYSQFKPFVALHWLQDTGHLS